MPGRVNTNDSIGDQCEMNEEHEDAIQFVESGEDPSKALQPTKQPFDLVAFFVHLLAIFPGTQAIGFGWYDGKHFKRQYQLARFIAFIGFVHDDMRSLPAPVFKGFQQLSPFRCITRLARRKREGHGRSGVGSNHVNFGCPACARFTNRLWTVFFNAPVPSGCTLTAVLSSET